MNLINKILFIVDRAVSRGLQLKANADDKRIFRNLKKRVYTSMESSV